MYHLRVLPQRPALAGSPLELPIDVLQAKPKYVTSDPDSPTYDLRKVVGQLLQNLIDEKRRTKVMKVKVWAPGLAQTPLDFPGSGKLANPNRKNYPQYEIIHFVGKVRWSSDDLALILDRREVVGTKTLQEALVAAHTRLLVLHVPTSQFREAYRLAEILVLHGGPAVLVAAGTKFKKGRDSEWGYRLDDYWHLFYLNILHNNSLRLAADPKLMPDMIARTVSASLVYGMGAEESLQLDQWMNNMEGRLKKARKQAAEQLNYLKELHLRKEQVLHLSKREEILPHLNFAKKRINKLMTDIKKQHSSLSEVRTSVHDSERKGVGPLSEIKEKIPQLEFAARSGSRRMVKKVERVIVQSAERAPRVLNANFTCPYCQDGMLPFGKGLLAGTECELLVDVGPKWDKADSIVIGITDFPNITVFPSLLLRQDVPGWEVQVVFVSSDFKPSTSSSKIWVPRKGGRSFPYQNGELAVQPGPVALHLRAPNIPEGQSQSSMTANGRLCLYYENNLLQSAAVRVGVVRTVDVALPQKNEIVVDYVLTGSFQEIDRFAGRTVRFGERSKRKSHPVALSLTLNDDGSGTHRIIIKPRTSASAATATTDMSSPNKFPVASWVKYDPAASTQALDQAREELINCFFERSINGEVADPQKVALNSKNGKNREQFKRDLKVLALVGNTLFDMVTMEIIAEGNEAAPNMVTRAIKQELADPAIIQVARTSSANYAFPWASIYDITLPGPRFEYCDIIDEEWNADGIRKSSAHRERCPYEADHKENILCPYGFWGLKHIIEQPLSALSKRPVAKGSESKEVWKFSDVVDKIQTGRQIKLAVGMTQNLDPKLLESHLNKIKQIFQLTTSVQPEATDVDMLRSLLPPAQLVYIACHGEYDQAARLPYLSIGPRDDRPIYRIYPNMVKGWMDTEEPLNLRPWETQHPLVFINGCHTTNLTPGQLLNFVSSFAYAQASGVLGTEINLRPPVAFEVAERFFALLSQIKQTATVGEAMYQIRWELVNKGSILGLAYTPYCLADLHFATQQ